MAFNPGIYDDDCTSVRERHQANGVILVVIGGQKGQGFSVQATGDILVRLPAILESIARQIREQMAQNLGARL